MVLRPLCHPFCSQPTRLLFVEQGYLSGEFLIRFTSATSLTFCFRNIQGSNSKIDGSFVATVLESAAVGVLYLAWKSITEGESCYCFIFLPAIHLVLSMIRPLDLNLNSCRLMTSLSHIIIIIPTCYSLRVVLQSQHVPIHHFPSSLTRSLVPDTMKSYDTSYLVLAFVTFASLSCLSFHSYPLPSRVLQLSFILSFMLFLITHRR